VWLERALANLVGNAVKYSPDAEPVDVTVDIEGGEVVVRVSDHGPGIPNEARERVFERFERLEGTATQTGTGLGLYITRQLVRAMGGNVTVEDLPSGGSTFTMHLPQRSASPVTAGSA
jgi:two-component system sensor histidine kinase KdpD